VWTSSTVALTTMDGRFYGYGIVVFGTSTDIGSVCVGICSSTDVLVCRAMDSFWLED
jgi:hypothetical protein